MGPQALGKNGKTWKKIFFDETQNLKSLWSKDCTHEMWVKLETIFFFVSKGGPFGAFLIFKVSISRHWSSLKDMNGGTESFECWNIDVDGCQNVQNSI